MSNPLNKHNIWRYALDKLLGSKRQGKAPSLSPARIAKDLKALADIANRRLNNLVSAGFGDLEYIKAVRGYADIGRSDLKDVALGKQKAALSVIADFVYDEDVSKVGTMRKNVKQWAKENEAWLKTETAQDMFHGDKMQAYADFQNWRFTMRSELYNDRRANYSMLYRFMAWENITPTVGKNGQLVRRLDTKYKDGDEIALAIWRWKMQGQPLPKDDQAGSQEALARESRRGKNFK